MRDDVWQALAEGDRSFVQFVLADDPFAQRGFRVDGYQGAVPHDPVFALVRSETELFVDPGDCVVEPIACGRYCFTMTLEGDFDYVAECDSLEKAWLLFEPLERAREARTPSL